MTRKQRTLAIAGARVDVIAVADEYAVPGVLIGGRLVGLDEARAQVALGRAIDAAITAAEALACQVRDEREKAGQ